MMNIEDGKYRKYERKLRDGFTEEEVTGLDIGKMEEQDLKSFGVTNFGDRKGLFQHLQNLIESQAYKPQCEGE